MPPFYTRSGDNGTTSVLGKKRLPKFHLQLEVLGTLDEVSAVLGLARSLSQSDQNMGILLEIQHDLYNLMAEIASIPENRKKFQHLDNSRVEWLESKMEILSNQVLIPNEFILPGDSVGGAVFSLARTVVRRSERLLAKFISREKIDRPVFLAYINRLSSLCFVLELDENQRTGGVTRKVGGKE